MEPVDINDVHACAVALAVASGADKNSTVNAADQITGFIKNGKASTSA